MAVFKIMRGGSLVDAINRAWAATGSVRLAQQTSNVDYNGHAVMVSLKPFAMGGARWSASYIWGGIQRLASGSFEICLQAAMAEFNRGASFASVTVVTETPKQGDKCLDCGLLPEDEVVDPRSADDRFRYVHEALRMEKQTGIPATKLLLDSKDREDWKRLCSEWIEEHRS